MFPKIKKNNVTEDEDDHDLSATFVMEVESPPGMENVI